MSLIWDFGWQVQEMCRVWEKVNTQLFSRGCVHGICMCLGFQGNCMPTSILSLVSLYIGAMSVVLLFVVAVVICVVVLGQSLFVWCNPLLVLPPTFLLWSVFTCDKITNLLLKKLQLLFLVSNLLLIFHICSFLSRICCTHCCCFRICWISLLITD